MPISSEILYLQAEERREQLQALYQLALEIAELHDLQQVLDTALRYCLELTDSQFGFIGLNTADGRAMDVVAIQGFQASERFYERFHLIPLRPSIFARAVLENRPVRSSDAMADPARIGQPKGHPPVQAFLGVPLRVQGTPMGMIGVANRPDAYTDEHEQLLMTYAAQVAIAIRNAQLYEELKAAKADLEQKVTERTEQLAQAHEALAQQAHQLRLLLAQTVTIQERERARIAHNMHDGVNQLIIGAILEVKSARERLASGNPARVESALRRVRAVLGQVDGEIKRIILDLRPPTLDALGLPPAILRYAERYQVFTGLPCQAQIIGQPRRLDPETEIGLYRVMQEALQNAAAHAQATKTWVHLTFLPESIHLEVGDDGQGFDLSLVMARREGHLGLVGMNERAQNLGGALTIEAVPQGGTRVLLDVPLSHHYQAVVSLNKDHQNGHIQAADSHPHR
ncbi:MAG TPA: GAF domain-containing sensor histidine kinase [Ktedonobacterales bacterium]|jgi:signal transduction histidine kinase